MKVVTSIGRSRIDRQQKCIASWIAAGCEVTAIQSAGETEILQQHFPHVKFIETKLTGNVFNRPKFVRISAMINEAPVIILNSDIEVRASPEVFTERWSDAEHKEIKVGIRWNEDPVTKKTEMFKWGIDAFLITPEMIPHLPDIGMTMGCPAWDYWIPIQLHRLGYRIITQKQEELIHEDHPKNWTNGDYRIGLELLRKHYHLSQRGAAMLVQKLTERGNLHQKQRVKRR